MNRKRSGNQRTKVSKRANQFSMKRLTKCDVCEKPIEDEHFVSACCQVYEHSNTLSGFVSICSSDHSCAVCGNVIRCEDWDGYLGVRASVVKVDERIGCSCPNCSSYFEDCARAAKEFGYDEKFYWLDAEKFGWSDDYLFSCTSTICYFVEGRNYVGAFSVGEFVESGFSDPFDFIKQQEGNNLHKEVHQSDINKDI